MALSSLREDHAALQADHDALLEQNELLSADVQRYEKEIRASQARARSAVEAEAAATAEALRRCATNRARAPNARPSS